MAEPIATIRKNTKEEIRVDVSQYNGRDLFGARVWYRTDDGKMRPSAKGIAFQVAQLPAFAEAVQAALTVAKKKGLL